MNAERNPAHSSLCVFSLIGSRSVAKWRLLLTLAGTCPFPGLVLDPLLVLTFLFLSLVVVQGELGRPCTGPGSGLQVSEPPLKAPLVQHKARLF